MAQCRKAPLKIIIAVCLVLPLAGCGAIINGYNQAERQKALDKANAQAASINAECAAKYPPQRGSAVKFMTCYRPGLALLRPFSSSPDLFDQGQATRMVIAERIDAGQI